MINEYRVGKCLGRGSMGEVYEGRHETRRVALKVLREGADDQLNAGRRLLEEARSVNAIRHPGIVEVLDIGLFTDRRPFLVMELLEGASLSARIKSSPVQWQEAVKWLDGILDALDAAHRAGVVHRDLKPSNVFLVGKPGDERVKILDFGVARRAGRKENFTAPQMAVGSVGFMAPEQLQGHAVPASDLYAVGCLAFQLFAGRPVFPLKNIPDAARLHMTEPAPLLRWVKPGLAEDLETWVDKLLRKNPTERHRSAHAAMLDLRSLDLDPELTHSRQRTELVPAFTPPNSRPQVSTAGSHAREAATMRTESVPREQPLEEGEDITDRAKTLFDS